MTTTIVMAVFAGIFATVLAGAIGYATWKLVQFGKQFITGLQGIGKIAESNRDLVESSRTVATELQLLRSLMSANVQQPPSSEDPREGEAGPSKPKPRVPFPTPTFDPYRIVPDAEENDTVITDTNDEQLVALEKIEELRQQGFEADPSELEEV